MKSWMTHDDVVLSNLSSMIINRNLLKVKLTKEEISDQQFEQLKRKTKEKYDLSANEVEYFVYKSTVSNQAYDSSNESIKILLKNGKVIEATEASDHLNLKVLSQPVKKYFVCYPKEL
jgi:hypothetical protein